MQLAQTDWVALVAAGLGAFVGSGSAFLLESRRQLRLDRRRQLSALQEVRFALTTQLFTLRAFRDHVLEPVRDDPERHLKLGHADFQISNMPLNVEKVTFLVESGETRALAALQDVRNLYTDTFSVLRRREAALEQVYYGGDFEAFDADTGEGRVNADPRRVAFLKNITDSLYRAVDTTIEYAEDAIDLLDVAFESG